MNNIPLLSVVIPCYNEQEIIDYTVNKLSNFLDESKKDKKIHPNSFLCFVNDGSKDNTWEKLLNIKSQYKTNKISKLE